MLPTMESLGKHYRALDRKTKALKVFSDLVDSKHLEEKEEEEEKE